MQMSANRQTTSLISIFWHAARLDLSICSSIPLPSLTTRSPFLVMAGAVENLGIRFRAHVQRRGSNGRKDHIHGPHRGEKRKAEQDLETLRAAAKHAGPGKAWSAMTAESRHLKERADFEREKQVPCFYSRMRDLGRPLPHPLSASSSPTLITLAEHRCGHPRRLPYTNTSLLEQDQGM